ncbi:MAG: molybdopterin cofactor-binding domain-containing protein [Candidatus Methylomirabilia bacterium]
MRGAPGGCQVIGEGRIHGAVAQEAGWALLERMAYDGHERFPSATLPDYALPAVDQVPSVEAVLVEMPSASGPFGAKGVSGPPLIATGSCRPACFALICMREKRQGSGHTLHSRSRLDG